jgi:hypothetical protein
MPSEQPPSFSASTTSPRVAMSGGTSGILNSEAINTRNSRRLDVPSQAWLGDCVGHGVVASSPVSAAAYLSSIFRICVAERIVRCLESVGARKTISCSCRSLV